MLFRRNFDKPGPGVEMRDPNQSRISVFFELLFRKLWRLCKVNMLYLITSLPTFIITMLIMGFFSAQITNAAAPLIAEMMGFTEGNMADPEFSSQMLLMDAIIKLICSFMFLVFIGQGPATAGMTYILKCYAKEQHAWLISDWWQYAKANFRQSLIVWAIDLVAVFIFITAIRVYMTFGGPMILASCIVSFMLLSFVLMHFYIYQMIITFDNSIKNIYKNAFILAIQKLPRNLLMLLIMIVIHIGIPYIGLALGFRLGFWILFILLELTILPSITGFMNNFFVYSQLEEFTDK